MSDRVIRDLERAAADDLEAAGLLLRQRVRSGELQRERLELAALLGDPAAMASGIRAEPARPYLERTNAVYENPHVAEMLATHPQPGVHPGNRAGLVFSVSAFGNEAVLRAAVAAARLCAPVLDVCVPSPSPTGPVLQSLQAKLSSPDSGWDEPTELLDADPLVNPPPVDGDEPLLGAEPNPPWDESIPDECQRDLPFMAPEGELAFRSLEAAAEAARRPEHALALAVEAVWNATLATRYEAVVACVERELIGWALGEDPIPRRLAAEA